MTIQNLLQQCRKKSHSKVLRFWVVLAAVALLLVLACRDYDWDALGRYKGDNISSLHYVRGRVVEVLRDDTKLDQLDPARSMGTQELRILLLEGANKGTEVTIANYLTRTQNVRLRQGETAIICEDLPDSATPAKVESMAAHVLGLGGLSSSRLTRVHTASAATVSGRDGSPW